MGEPHPSQAPWPRMLQHGGGAVIPCRYTLAAPDGCIPIHDITTPLFELGRRDLMHVNIRYMVQFNSTFCIVPYMYNIYWICIQ